MLLRVWNISSSLTGYNRVWESFPKSWGILLTWNGVGDTFPGPQKWVSKKPLGLFLEDNIFSAPNPIGKVKAMDPILLPPNYSLGMEHGKSWCFYLQVSPISPETFDTRGGPLWIKFGCTLGEVVAQDATVSMSNVIKLRWSLTWSGYWISGLLVEPVGH